jgi:ADP-heptose:LPS heptosyltransferase
MHLSIAAGTPTVALFGPTDPAKLLPPGSERFKALKAASGRMTDIAPQEILETILSA